MSTEPQPTESLYSRLGGRTVIHALLVKFYATAGDDPIVGPIFNAAVSDWEHHLDHVTDFWSTQTGGPALYPGGMGRHIRLGLGPEHFTAWLAIWEKTCREELPPAEADDMIRIARVFAGRLKQMTGNAGFGLRP